MNTNLKKVLAALAAAALVAGCTACQSASSEAASAASSAQSAAQTALKADTVASTSEMFTDRDYEVGYSDYVTITLSDSGVTSDGGGYNVSGSVVTITQAGTYLLTGTLTNPDRRGSGRRRQGAARARQRLGHLHRQRGDLRQDRRQGLPHDGGGLREHPGLGRRVCADRRQQRRRRDLLEVRSHAQRRRHADGHLRAGPRRRLQGRPAGHLRHLRHHLRQTGPEREGQRPHRGRHLHDHRPEGRHPR